MRLLFVLLLRLRQALWRISRPVAWHSHCGVALILWRGAHTDLKSHAHSPVGLFAFSCRPSSGSSRRWTGSKRRSCTWSALWTASTVRAAVAATHLAGQWAGRKTGAGACPGSRPACCCWAHSDSLLEDSPVASFLVPYSCHFARPQRGCCCWTWRAHSGAWSGAMRLSAPRQVRRALRLTI